MEHYMKRALLVLAFFFAFSPRPLWAGQIYGILREADRPVGANVKIEVVCGNSTYSTVTDNSGLYRLFAKETGRCVARAYYQNQTPQTVIDSYANPAHYDFDLVRQQNGQYDLRRR
jgi:hypothetical protein